MMVFLGRSFKNGLELSHFCCQKWLIFFIELLIIDHWMLFFSILGTTPLHWASYYGQPEVARYLLSFINDTDSRTKKGETPLHFATKTENFEVLKILLEFSKNKNPANNAGMTLLHLGAKQGNLAIFEHVWNLTLEKNPGNDSGFTPLHVACERGHLDIVKFLVSRLKG